MTSLSFEELAAFVDQLSVSQQDDLYHLLLTRQAQRRTATAEPLQRAMDVITMWLTIRNSSTQPKDAPNAPQG